MQFDKLLRPSPAMVIAAVALFVSLGGTALAVTSINGNQLKNRSVAGVKDVKLELTFDPPWDKSRMSKDARMLLGMDDVIPLDRLTKARR